MPQDPDQRPDDEQEQSPTPEPGTGGSGPAPIEAQVSWRPLHIAMVGQKGLPATYGGIEHVVSERKLSRCEVSCWLSILCEGSCCFGSMLCRDVPIH